MQSELHGLAALQWSICQDSLRRYNLRSHLLSLCSCILYVELNLLNIIDRTDANKLLSCRPDEARIMYEKLRSHPNVSVNKKAKQILFSFQVYKLNAESV